MPKYQFTFAQADEIDSLLKSGKKIEALRQVRTICNCDLEVAQSIISTVTIKHTVVKSETRRVFEQDTTKTASSHRTYPLTPGLVSLFLAIRDSEAKNREKFGTLYEENDYIFKWDYGKIYDPDFVTRHFRKLLERSGMPKIRFHDLRHSCASMLASKGFKLKDIQEWLGHADIQTTANTYAHLYQERKEKIAQSIEFDESLLVQISEFPVRNLLEKC